MYARCMNINTIGIACRMYKSMVEDELQKGHRRISASIIHKHHMKKFCGWFRSHVRLTSSTFGLLSTFPLVELLYEL